MSNKQYEMTMLTMVMLACIFSAKAQSSTIETTSEPFSVALGASRVIYNPDSAGVSLMVMNPQDYPILVQSQVMNTDRSNKAPFVVTPPLMRLDGQQSSHLRIVRTGGEFAADRESLQWICVKGIPPKADDAWNDSDKKKAKQFASNQVSLAVKLSISNCIKLFVRPSSIKGQPYAAGKKLRWQQQGKTLKAHNDSPFYINLSSLKLGGVAIQSPQYIAPYSTQAYALPNAARGKQVEWQTINDYGGEDQIMQVDIQ